MSKAEYDLVKASETRQLKRVELVDFDGRTLISIPWEIQFQAFKCFWNNGAIYRFSFVFGDIVYYQRSGVLDIITLTPVKDLNQ